MILSKMHANIVESVYNTVVKINIFFWRFPDEVRSISVKKQTKTLRQVFASSHMRPLALVLLCFLCVCVSVCLFFFCL